MYATRPTNRVKYTVYGFISLIPSFETQDIFVLTPYFAANFTDHSLLVQSLWHIPTCLNCSLMSLQSIDYKEISNYNMHESEILS